MKNKKILTRLFAVLATLLLVGAMALPCFADGVVSDESYCVKTITFTDRASAHAWMLDNRYEIIRCVLSADLLDEPLVFDSVESVLVGNTTYFRFSKFTIGASNSQVDFGGIILVLTNIDALVTMSPVGVTFLNDGTFTMDELDVTTFPDDYWANLNTSLTVYYYEEFTPTVAPIDPDAPTRTGLYGELYHIIRDAIYGENALLDSTQEFTLTQIATWMTYIVILLPFVVIAIILFKIFVR